MALALAAQMQFAGGAGRIVRLQLLPVMESARLPLLSGHLPPSGALGRFAFTLSNPLFCCPPHKPCQGQC